MLAVLTLLLSATGCENQSRQAGKLLAGGTITFIGPPAAIGDWDVIAAAARQAVAPFTTLRLEATTCPDTDPQARAQAYERAARSGARVVCVVTPDTRTDEPLLAAARRTAVPLITVGAGPYRTPAFGHVEIAWADGAGLLGRQLTALLDDHRSYAVVHPVDGPPAAADCYTRFMQFARQQRTLALLEDIPGDPAELPARLRTLITTFPHLSMVVSVDPQPASIRTVLASLPPETRVATLGATRDLWPLLRDGRAAALCGPLASDIGQAAMELALQALTQSSRSGGVRVISCRLVTRDDLDEFTRRYEPRTTPAPGAKKKRDVD